jgi:hypothetical protein
MSTARLYDLKFRLVLPRSLFLPFITSAAERCCPSPLTRRTLPISAGKLSADRSYDLQYRTTSLSRYDHNSSFSSLQRQKDAVSHRVCINLASIFRYCTIELPLQYRSVLKPNPRLSFLFILVKLLAVVSYELNPVNAEDIEADLTSDIRNSLNNGEAVPGQVEAARAVSRLRVPSDRSSASRARSRIRRNDGGDSDSALLELWGRSLSLSFSLSLTSAPTSSPEPSPSPSAAPSAAPTLGTTVRGSTAGAPSPKNNPICADQCTNGCPSRWYRVTGTGQRLTASTCNFANFDTRILIWKGPCASLECVGTY